MLLDLTIRPVQVTPDECPRSLVIRTLGTGTHVNGTIGRREQWYAEDRTAHKRKPTALKPVAEVPRQSRVYKETRLPLGRSQTNRYERYDRAPLKTLPEPYEVSTAYRDVITDRMGVAEFKICVEHPPSKDICLVTAQEGDFHLSFIIKNWDEAPVFGETELTPLQRLKHLKDRPATTAWDRILHENEVEDYDAIDFD